MSNFFVSFTIQKIFVKFVHIIPFLKQKSLYVINIIKFRLNGVKAAFLDSTSGIPLSMPLAAPPLDRHVMVVKGMHKQRQIMSGQTFVFQKMIDDLSTPHSVCNLATPRWGDRGLTHVLPPVLDRHRYSVLRVPTFMEYI